MMKGSTLGKFSLIFGSMVAVMFVLHFTNVILVLNVVVAPLFALLGTLAGLIGYFERDKKRIPALVGMLLNAALLTWWIVLFVQSLGK
jgi:hypothetical protein